MTSPLRIVVFVGLLAAPLAVACGAARPQPRAEDFDLEPEPTPVAAEALGGDGGAEAARAQGAPSVSAAESLSSGDGSAPAHAFDGPAWLEGALGPELAAPLRSFAPGARQYVYVDMRAVRAHPVGAKSAEIVSAMLNARELFGSQLDVVHDLEWIAVLGPTTFYADPKQTMVASVRNPNAAKTAIAALRRKSTRLDPSPHKEVDLARGQSRVGARSVLFSPRTLVVTAPEEERALADAIRATRVPEAPSREAPLEYAVVREPGTLPALPETIRAVRLRVEARGAGALALGEAECASEEDARATAELMRTTAEQRNTFVVRLATRNLLGGARFGTRGRTVTMELPVDRDQLTSLLNLVANALAVPLPFRGERDGGAGASGVLPIQARDASAP
jgi:hypothetical protein